MDKITVVCHKDHDKGYEDYVGKCLLCEVERLERREWVGLTDQEIWDISVDNQQKGGGFWGYPRALEAKLKEKNT